MPRPQPGSAPDGCWPSCDDDQPGVSIRPLHHGDLAALLGHLQEQHHRRDPGNILEWREPAPVVAVRVRASVGQPGASAHAQYRRRRATELTAWARGLPWRILALVVASVAAWLAAARVAPNLAAPIGVTVAAGLGWRLRFRTPPGHRGLAAWRDRGAAHRPAAGPAGAARLGGPARPGHRRHPGQHRSLGHRPWRGGGDRQQAVPGAAPSGP
jgi:hypothetical protein